MPTDAVASIFYLRTGDHKAIVLKTKKPCETVPCVVTQVIGPGTQARLKFELISQFGESKPIFLVETVSPLGEFMVVLNPQPGSSEMNLK
jgi:hypothetical protein